jgi:hypothetical protein
VGFRLGTTEKTIKVHRARVMEKMEAESLADLVRMAGFLGITALRRPLPEPVPPAVTDSTRCSLRATWWPSGSAWCASWPAEAWAELYEAEDEELKERVALQTVLPAVAADERTRQLFSEVHLARQVTHPNVCRIFDVFRHHPADSQGTAQDMMVLAMELLHGETLADRLRERGRLPTSEVLPLLRQLAAGLTAAHRAGVVHRDLKTGNVMLVPPAPPEPGLRAVITDFGLARRSAEEDGTNMSLIDGGIRARRPGPGAGGGRHRHGGHRHLRAGRGPVRDGHGTGLWPRTR